MLTVIEVQENLNTWHFGTYQNLLSHYPLIGIAHSCPVTIGIIHAKWKLQDEQFSYIFTMVCIHDVNTLTAYDASC
jgi:type III secretory pathway component EscS